MTHTPTHARTHTKNLHNDIKNQTLPKADEGFYFGEFYLHFELDSVGF